VKILQKVLGGGLLFLTHTVDMFETCYMCHDAVSEHVFTEL